MATEKRLIDQLREIADLTPPICQYDNPEKFTVFGKEITAYCKPFEQFQELLRRAVDAVEVKRGQWVLTVHEEQCNFRWNVTAECSECQHSKGEIYAGHFSGFPKDLVESMLPLYAKRVKLDNYCPNCGADMRGSEE